MTYCIDDMWILFKQHVSDHDVRLAFAKELIVDSEYENLYGNPFCRALMEFLAKHDDEYFLILTCIDDEATVEEVIDNLKFQMDENDLSQERRDRLFALWLKSSGKFASDAARIEALSEEEQVLMKRIHEIQEELQIITGKES